MEIWGVRAKFKDREEVWMAGSRFQAEYLIFNIPMLMVSDNKLVRGIVSARIVLIK